MNETLKPTKEYKLRGELERQYQLEPQPRTPITETAQSILLSWGLSLQDIQGIQDLASSFRYRECEEKLERMAQNPIEIYTLKDGIFVNIVDYLDVSGRLDGQCSDIALQWIIHSNDTGLIHQLNKNCVSGRKIVTAHYEGTSRTHFTNAGLDNHVWSGLVLLDEQNNTIGEVYVDCSFQNIMSPEESGYRQSRRLADANSYRMQGNMIMPVTAISASDISSGKIEKIAEHHPIFIGQSNDGYYVYGFNFLRNVLDGWMYPSVTRRDSSGDSIVYIDTMHNKIIGTDVLTSFFGPPPEVKQLLSILSRVEFVSRPPTETEVIWTKK